MSENGKVLLDSCRILLLLVFSILLFPLLLLLSVTHTKGTSTLGTLLLTLLLSTSLPSSSPSAAQASCVACTSSKELFTVSQRENFSLCRSSNSSCQQNSLTTTSRGRCGPPQSCPSRPRCSSRNQQQRVSFFQAKSAGSLPPVDGYRRIYQTLLLSNKCLPSLRVCRSRTHSCCCCVDTNNNSAFPRQGAAAFPLTHRFRLLSVSSSDTSDRRRSLGKRAARSSLKKPPTDTCCSSSSSTSTCSRCRRRHIVHDSSFWQQGSRMQFAASRGRNILFACRLLRSLFDSRQRVVESSLSVFFIAGPVSALPAALNVLNFSARRETSRQEPQGHSEESDKTQQQKAKRTPISCWSASQRCWDRLLKHNCTTPVAAVKLAAAAAAVSGKAFGYYVNKDTEVPVHGSFYAPYAGGSCCCWMPAAAKSFLRSAKTSAAGVNGPSSRKLVRTSERKAHGGGAPLTEEAICFSSPGASPLAAEREGCSGGEEEEQCVKGRSSTLNQLEKDLQRRHRAVGLAIKTGDPAVAFNAFDKHLQYAAIAVRQWVLHRGRSYSMQLQQQQCSWKPESIVPQTAVLPKRDLQHEWRKKQQQHWQQGQGDEDQKEEKKTPGVERQNDSEAQQQEAVRRHDQNEGSCQRKEGDLRKWNDEEEASSEGLLWVRQTCREGDGDTRLLHASVLTLMKPFVKSASGVLNLCYKDESGESSRATQYMIARQVLRRLKEFHLLYPFDTDVGNAFLTVAAAAGDTEAVAATLLLMQQQGVRPQRKGYDALLRILLRQGEGYRCLRQSELLRCMLDQRLPPTPEQLFALLLRDAARVRVQLDKEQQAVETLKSLLHQCNPQQLLQREKPPQQHAVPSVHLDGVLKRKKNTHRDEGEDAGLERRSPLCCYAANATFSSGDRRSVDRMSPSHGKKDTESYTAAVVGARAALVEEVKKSLHVLREFVSGMEDALLLLQEVVSEQLPLLSDKAASRFIAALQTLQFPSIAHISRVVVTHCAPEADSNEQEFLSKAVRAKDTSYLEDMLPADRARPRGTGAVIAAFVGANIASRELFSLHKAKIGDIQRSLEDALVGETNAEEKRCDSKVDPEKKTSLFSETRSHSEAERAFIQAEYCDVSLRRNDLQGHQQQQLDQASGALNDPLPLLQRSAVCAGCGTRLRRVCLTNNERRLLRLGVLKLSAMLHPRQLRALLAFERALGYNKELGLPVSSSMTRRHISTCSPGACERGLQPDPRLPFPHKEQQTKQACGRTSSLVNAVGKSELPAKSGDAPAAAVAYHFLPAPSGVASAPPVAAAEKTGGDSGGGKHLSWTTDRTDEIISAVRKGTAGEWRTRGEGDLRRRLKENTVAGQWNTSMNQVVYSLLPRYTVVLDAANIAYNSQNRQEGVFSYPQIERVRQELLGRGERPLIILPSAYYWGFSKQRSKQEDQKSCRKKRNFNRSASSEETTATHDSSSSSRNDPLYQYMHSRLAERSRRTICGQCLPPEANRLWLCRKGLCPLCTDEIQVPNRCKKSNRCSSSTPPKLPVEPSCWPGGSTGSRHNDVDEAENIVSKNQTTTDNVRYRSVSSIEGGQRLSCLDRALLRLWEQEKCLFVCRSGAHDDHYHLLASLCAYSPDPHTASSALLRLHDAGGVPEGMEALQNPVPTSQLRAGAQPARHTQQQDHKVADLPTSSLHHCARARGSPAGEKRQQRQQRTAKRSPYDVVSSDEASHKEKQEDSHLPAESLLNIMLGTEAGERSSRSDHWNTEKQTQSYRHTCSPQDVALLGTSRSLWQRLWCCVRSRDGVPPEASNESLHSPGNRVEFAVGTVADDHRETPRVSQSATAFLGYAWDDFTCRREVRNGVQQEDATVSLEEVHYPVALLTNDRFRDHRLSSQQKTAFKHWRQLALQPYVFQRRLILSRNGFAEVSPAESGGQHTATLLRRSGRRMYGGALHPHEHNSTDQQQDRSTAVSGDHSLLADGNSSEGDILEKVAAEATRERLADEVETVGLKMGRKAENVTHQEMPGDDVFHKHEKAEKDHTDVSDWASRLPHGTESDFLDLVGAHAWGGRRGFNSTERQAGEWSLADLDIAADQYGSAGESITQRNSKKSTFCGDAERFNRTKREKSVFGRGTRCGDCVGEEMEPLLFIGLLQPVTRRVQVSIRKNKSRGLRSGVKVSETPIEHAVSLLDLSYTSTPHEGDAVFWHIPLRRAEEEAFQKEGDLFATHSVNVTANRPGAHTLTRISEHSRKKQESFRDVMPTPNHDSLSAYTRVNVPNEEADRSPQLTKIDALRERSRENKEFADFDMLNQNSREDVQGEEALAESDVWLGIELTPFSQLLQAREQFLRSVDLQVF